LNQRCWWREFLLKGAFFVVGFSFGAGVVLVLKHLRYFDDHVPERAEWLFGLVTGGLLYVLGEVRGAHVEFRFPHPWYFGLRTLITDFIHDHRGIGDDQKARVALSLMRAIPHVKELEFKTTIGGYIHLLTAATESAISTFFATYCLPLNEWDAVSRHCNSYFELLKKTPISKARIVIAPQRELQGLTRAHQIYRETTDYGIDLGKAPRESFPSVRDYALFDDSLVIEGGLLPDPHSNAGADREMQVRLLKGDKVNEYCTERKRLMEYVKQNHTFYRSRKGPMTEAGTHHSRRREP
jgi:hypothetical protein